MIAVDRRREVDHADADGEKGGAGRAGDPGHAEDGRGVADDDADAAELLKEHQPEADHQWGVPWLKELPP